MKGELAKRVKRARSFFERGETRDLAARREGLERLDDVLQEKKDEILSALAEDLGKPGLEAYLAEYHFLRQEIALVKRKMKGWLGPKRVLAPPYFWPCRSWVAREPFGTILVMAPWNYPIQLALSPVVAAVAAGNSVVLKPSEMSSASEKVIHEIVEEAFPDGRVVTVTGGAEVAESLMEERFDFIFFTGSTRVGRKVAVKAAESLTPVILELGGKCPCMIDSSVDLEIAARRVLAGKFFNGGQTCFAPDFVLIEESVRESFVKACEAVMAEVPWAEEMSKMISPQHAERLRELSVGKVLVFGQDDEDRGFVAPRILPEASWDGPAMKDEIFGPVLPVLGFQNESELLERLRSLSKPLAIYCFSKRKSFVERVSGTMASGSVCINDTMKQFSQLKLPLGGVGESGYGRYRGRFGVEALSYQRSMTRRYLTRKDYTEVLPPYEKAYRWIRKFLK